MKNIFLPFALEEYISTFSALFHAQAGNALVGTVATLLCALAYTGPLVSGIALLFYAVTKKIFYDKFAYQLFKLCLPALLLATAVVSYYIFIPRCDIDMLIICLLLVTPLGLQIALYFTWDKKRLKKFLAPIALLPHLLTGMAISYILRYFLSDSGWKATKNLFNEWHKLGKAHFGTLGSEVSAQILWLLPAAYAAALLWTIMRRNKDDYGRDYYAFSMRHAAQGALGTCLSFLFFGIAIFCFYDVQRSFFEIYTLYIAGVLFSFSCLLWLVIARSTTPLCHKATAVAACFFFLAAWWLLMLIAVKLYKVY